MKESFKFFARYIVLAFFWVVGGLALLPMLSSAPPVSMEEGEGFFWTPDVEVVRDALRNPWSVDPIPPELIDTETLWLARVIHAESDLAKEQELVAWVVRNRAETGYRDRFTVEGVVNDPFQFQPFIEGTDTRRYYTSLTPMTPGIRWQRSLSIAYYVSRADASLRPFSQGTRHFYSEQSLAHPDSIPEWSMGHLPIVPDRFFEIEPERFRFFENIP